MLLPSRRIKTHLKLHIPRIIACGGLTDVVRQYCSEWQVFLGQCIISVFHLVILINSWLWNCITFLGELYVIWILLEKWLASVQPFSTSNFFTKIQPNDKKDYVFLANRVSGRVGGARRRVSPDVAPKANLVQRIAESPEARSAEFRSDVAPTARAAQADANLDQSL